MRRAGSVTQVPTHRCARPGAELLEHEADGAEVAHGERRVPRCRRQEFGSGQHRRCVGRAGVGRGRRWRSHVVAPGHVHRAPLSLGSTAIARSEPIRSVPRPPRPVKRRLTPVTSLFPAFESPGSRSAPNGSRDSPPHIPRDDHVQRDRRDGGDGRPLRRPAHERCIDATPWVRCDADGRPILHGRTSPLEPGDRGRGLGRGRAPEDLDRGGPRRVVEVVEADEGAELAVHIRFGDPGLILELRRRAGPLQGCHRVRVTDVERAQDVEGRCNGRSSPWVERVPAYRADCGVGGWTPV